MRLLKPDWVNHDGQPIFSIDIHPDGSRFATGGQGYDCGRVVIWNMAPVISGQHEKDPTIPKLLCRLDNHLSCVNAVRWSHSGTTLASAGVDKLIMIWQTAKSSGSSGSVFGSNIVNVENWKCISTLTMHSCDVLDISWSPNDTWLASSSIDNTIIIWNANKFPEAVTTLRGHSGMVKGVTWDPLGKYVASQSDDKTLRVWRTSDWSQETKITTPFEEAGGTTHSLRLAWGPDGQNIVSAHAMNNSGPTAQLIEREGWKLGVDFVGHCKAVTCVKFVPNIITAAIETNGKQYNYTCFAIGSRDRSISIWLTKLKRPLVVLKDLFTNSVTDLSWHTGLCKTYQDAGLKGGDFQAMCCSDDGTVAYMDFEQDEIGRPLSSTESMMLLQGLYGKSCGVLMNGTPNLSSYIIEDPEFLLMREEYEEKAFKQVEQNGIKEKSNKAVEQNGESLMKDATKDTAIVDALSKELVAQKTKETTPPPPDISAMQTQIEVRTPDGKRRIRPVFLSSGSVGDTLQPFTAGISELQSTSIEGKSSVIIEKRDFIPNGEEMIRPMVVNGNCVGPSSLALDAKSLCSNDNIPSVTEAEIESVSANEKIQDLPTSAKTVSETGNKDSFELENGSKTGKSKTSSDLLQDTLDSVAHGNSEKDKQSSVIRADKQEKQRYRLKEKEKMWRSSKHGVKRPRPSTSDGHKNQTDSESEPTAKDVNFTASFKPQEPRVTASPSVQHPVPSNSTLSTTPLLRLPSLSPGSIKSVKIPTQGVGEASVVLENNVQISSSVYFHRVRRVEAGTTVWETALSSRTTGASVSQLFCCVTCEDTSVHVFSSDIGRRIHPAFVLGSLASRVHCHKHYAMIVTSAACVSVWNLTTNSILVKNESLLPILTDIDTVVTATSLTEIGCPLISTSNGKTFTFDFNLGTWLLILEASSAVQRCSDYSNLSSNSPVVDADSPLAYLQSNNKRFCKVAQKGVSAPSSLQQCLTLSHLENQLVACEALNSPKEYKIWLLALVRFFVQEGLETKLRELCDRFIGPVFPSKTNKWEPRIMGINKQDLLQEMLPLMVGNLKLQRMLTEYREQLSKQIARQFNSQP